MEIKGKVIAILPEVTGNGKNGDWKSQEFIVEIGGQYPKKVCLKCFNKPVPNIDEYVEVHIEPESREYNGRWYTSLMVWKFEHDGKSDKRTEIAASTQTIEQPPVVDDLPF